MQIAAQLRGLEEGGELADDLCRQGQLNMGHRNGLAVDGKFHRCDRIFPDQFGFECAQQQGERPDLPVQRLQGGVRLLARVQCRRGAAVPEGTLAIGQRQLSMAQTANRGVEQGSGCRDDQQAGIKCRCSQIS